MNVLKLGIIGAGRMARKHLEVISAIAGLEAVAIISRTRLKAEAIASEYAIPAVFDDLNSMVNGAQPDALMILVSCDQTYQVMLDALAHGLPLFVEKPAGGLPEYNRNLVAHVSASSRLGTMFVSHSSQFP